MSSDQPAIRWQSRGQTALFNGNDYYQPHRDIPYLSPELVSDDELAESWRRPTTWKADNWSADSG
ncbi:MAG: hypothetical protein AAFN30_20980 [Actinomycetota bacterium]